VHNKKCIYISIPFSVCSRFRFQSQPESWAHVLFGDLGDTLFMLHT